MKITYEKGDVVYYEGQRCTVQGPTQLVNGLEGVHLTKPNTDIVLAPVSVLKSENDRLLEQCIECLNAYEQWEADLTTDDGDDVLEMMSTDNYNMLINIQKMRNAIGHAISERNSRKN